MSIIFLILITHWIADFVLQTDEDAKGKSTSMRHLLSHTITYSLFFGIVISGFCLLGGFPLTLALAFTSITFVTHTVTDYITSRWNTKLYQGNNIHGFFVSVGYDQLLHYFQLFITFQYLFM